MKIAAKDLTPGILIDLETCEYAYPGPGERGDVFDYEYGLVDEIEWETDDCVIVHTENLGSFGMPPEYQVDTAGMGA